MGKKVIGRYVNYDEQRRIKNKKWALVAKKKE